MSSMGEAGDNFSLAGELLELFGPFAPLPLFICWPSLVVCCSRRDWILLLPSALCSNTDRDITKGKTFHYSRTGRCWEKYTPGLFDRNIATKLLQTIFSCVMVYNKNALLHIRPFGPFKHCNWSSGSLWDWAGIKKNNVFIRTFFYVS